LLLTIQELIDEESPRTKLCLVLRLPKNLVEALESRQFLIAADEIVQDTLFVLVGVVELQHRQYLEYDILAVDQFIDEAAQLRDQVALD